MDKLMKKPALRLLSSRQNLVTNDDFKTLESWTNLVDWNGDEWHVMTTDTNVDKSTGLPGGLALECAGAFKSPSIMIKGVKLRNYGELVFEHYVQNPLGDAEANYLLFYVDGTVKLEVKGASPWQRCEPIGLTPGVHELKFEYYIEKGEPIGKKAVVDTFMVWEAADIECLITEYSPPRPSNNINSSKTLRGFNRYQQMTEADTSIEFTALFNGLQFRNFITISDEVFYFVDEFGVAYRGIFPEKIEPKSIALNESYEVALEMLAPQQTGVGFC